MARKHLWTMEQLKTMADEINAKRSQDPKYNTKLYAQENNIVYGTLYQALRRNGLLNPSRIRKAKNVASNKTLEASMGAEINPDLEEKPKEEAGTVFESKE